MTDFKYEFRACRVFDDGTIYDGRSLLKHVHDCRWRFKCDAAGCADYETTCGGRWSLCDDVTMRYCPDCGGRVVIERGRGE